MVKDIRIATSFPDHPKHKRLMRLIGPMATYYLIRLWVIASQAKPKGFLAGWDESDIAEAAGFPQDREPHVLVKALMDCGSPGFLEIINGVYYLHDWEDHQGWVCGAPERSESAKKAARARWAKRLEESTTDAQEMRGASKTGAGRIKNGCGMDADSLKKRSPVSLSVSPSISQSPSGGTRGGIQQAFHQFWKVYPKRLNKGQAEKAWKSLNLDEQLLAEILRGIEQAKTSEKWRKDGGQFIPYPATWLRAKGWLDEIDEKGERNGGGKNGRHLAGIPGNRPAGAFSHLEDRE